MKRDMEIVRQIILATGELPPATYLQKLEGIDPHVFSMHVIWLQEAGLISAFIQPVF